MRLVIDCNVVVAAARTDGICRRALIAALRNHEVVVSEPILAEYRQVAARPKQATAAALLTFLIDRIEQAALCVEPAPTAFGLADPADEVYLATAVAGGADVLITGNIRDFTLPFYQSVEVLTPRAFVDREN
jgi:putative PIN family toxin of toxin-antitoxin system